MRIATIFYSKTGTTRKIILEIIRKLKVEGILIDVFEVKPLRNYSKPLHLNPRLIYETLIKRSTEIIVIPYEPKLKNYDLLILASPIWCETVAPPIREFIKKHRFKGKKVVCITTSLFPLKYSKKLGRIAEREGGYEVIYHVNIAKSKACKNILCCLRKGVKVLFAIIRLKLWSRVR